MMSKAGNGLERVKVLVDTDIGSEIDDALALAYLVGNPACDLSGITTVTQEAGIRAMIASAVCRAAGRPDIPIHPGCEQALDGSSFQRLSSQASVLAALDHQTVFPTPDAVSFLRHTILRHSGDIVLLALGPLTHMARLFESDPQIPRCLRRLVTMCGNFAPKDAGAGEQSAEWNARLDPEAADIVFRTPVPGGHYIVGLETTQGLYLPTKALMRRPESAALQVVLRLYRADGRPDRPMTIYDLAAAVLALKPELAETERGNATLALDHRRGATGWQRDHKSGRHLLFTSISSRKIIREFLSSFNTHEEQHS